MAEEKEKAVKCLRQLRNLLTDDVDLKLPIHDERFLIRFVRAKNYDAELAYKTVRNYYTARKKNPKVYKIAYPSFEPVKFLLESNAIGKMKHNDPEGRPVIVFRNDLWDLQKANLDQVNTALILVLEEINLYSLESQLNGVVFLSDFTGLTLTYVKEFTLGRIRHFVNIWQGNYPVKLKGLYIIKEPTIMDIILVPTRQLMSEKIKSRMLIYGDDMTKLHDKIPPKHLWTNYGGTLTEDEFYDQEFKQTLLKRDSYYKEMVDYGFGNWDSEDEDTYM